jgi:hypothetical protein
MSQFLWVEDFEEKDSVKPYTDFVFGEQKPLSNLVSL